MNRRMIICMVGRIVSLEALLLLLPLSRRKEERPRCKRCMRPSACKVHAMPHIRERNVLSSMLSPSISKLPTLLEPALT